MDGLVFPRLWRGPVCGADDEPVEPVGGEPGDQGAGAGGEGSPGVADPAPAGAQDPPAPKVEGEAAPGERVEAPAGEGEAERLRAELAEARAERLAAHRRAVLAENAGRVIPELVIGETVEALDASVELSRAVYQRVREAAIAEISAAASVGPGNGARGESVDVESMSSLQRIAYGLRPGRG